MKSKISIVVTLSMLLIVGIATDSYAAPERRTALVIGNSAYSAGPLANPVNDATDVAATLKDLGFSVTLKRNMGLRETENAIRDLGNQLKRGGVGLFYYAGHAIQMDGVNYLIPVGMSLQEETDVKYEAVNIGRVLDAMYNAGNGLNILILDACRDNPYARSFRSAGRGLAIIPTAPSGMFISYSTGAGQTASDGKGRNSPYTRALLENVKVPGLPIEQVFKRVRQKLSIQTGDKQIPWEYTSLTGDFYFRPGRAPVEAEKLMETPPEEVAMAKPPPLPPVSETGRDGRFIAYSDGTVLDTSTNLMWAATDNGSNIDWHGAKQYCESYRGGGYTDWRMPTWHELSKLYDKSKSRLSSCHQNLDTIKIRVATVLIDITCSIYWAYETRGSDAADFSFSSGMEGWGHKSIKFVYRTLPVRFGK